MSEINLKPCPFCGQTDHLEIEDTTCCYPDEYYYCYVYCNRCDASIYGAECDTLEEAEASAVKRWNTRTKVAESKE